MRRTVTVVLAVLTIAAGTVGTASVASADPEVAHGTYLAQDGRTADGTRVAESAPVTDAALGICYDLLTPSGARATWTRTLNRTDRLAQVSERSCDIARAEGPGPLTLLAPGQQAGRATGWRSVRFSVMR